MQAARCWRPALLVLVLGSPCFAAPAGGFWEADLEAAKQLAARTNRLVLVHFGAPWCQPCQQLEREVFSQPGFGNDLKPHFVGVKLNYDSFPATARQYGVQSIPTDVILTPQGQLIERVQSPQSSTEFSSGLIRVAQMSRNAGAAVAATRPPQPATPTSAASPPPSSAAPPAAGDRYADYYNRQAAQQAPAANPFTQSSPTAGVAPPPTSPPPGAAPQLASAAMMNPQTPPPQAPAPQGSPLQAPPQQPPAGAPRTAVGAAAGLPQIPPGNAPLGLDGFCPVSLKEKQAWVPGDVRFGMQHHGRTYLFASPDEMQRFQMNPDRFSPVMSGDDPVIALDQGQHVAGSRMYGVSYADHVYLFCSEQTLQVFQQNPNRYAAEAVQARH